MQLSEEQYMPGWSLPAANALRQIEELADHLPYCSGVEIITSEKGHDGFLAEADQTAEILQKTLALAQADEQVHV